MKNLYISRALERQGVTREEAWEIINQLDKECVLHQKYKKASLLRISWMPADCTETPTFVVILVLTDANGKKDIELLYFYEDGVFCSDGKTRRFTYLYQLHAYKDKELDCVGKSLPTYLQKHL